MNKLSFLRKYLFPLSFIITLPTLCLTQETSYSQNTSLTSEESSQLDYLLNNFDCDLNNDKKCDEQDKEISKQIQQYQNTQQNQQKGQAGQQIAQQLIQQLLSSALKGGGKNPSPPNDPPSPPSPPAPDPKPEDEKQPDLKELQDAVNKGGKDEGAFNTPKRGDDTTTTTTASSSTSSTSTTTTTEKEKTEAEKEYEKLLEDPKKALGQEYNEWHDSKLSNVKDLDESVKNNPNLKPGQPAGDSLTKFDSYLRDSINNGSLTPQEAAKLKTLAQYDAHFKTSAGEYFGGKNGISLASQSKDFSNLIDNEINYASKHGWDAASTKLIEQELFHAADVSTVVQYGGTCWTCAGVQSGYFTNAAEMANAHHLILDNGSFKGITSQQLSLNPNNGWTPSGGTASLANQIDVGLSGKLAGNYSPWGGGNPNTIAYGIQQITGQPVNLNTYGYNFNSQLNFINGTDPVGITYPFNGHAASFSSIYSLDSTGTAVKYVLGDNSWSPTNEVFVQATAANAGKLTFPGGYGGGGPGGLGGFASGLGNGIFGNNGNLFNPNKNQNNNNAQNAIDQQKKEDLKNAYDSLSAAQKEELNNRCKDILSSNQSLPSVCFLSLGGYGLEKTSVKVSNKDKRKKIDVDLLKF